MNTGLPSNYVVPTTSHQFNYFSGSQGLVNIPLVGALIATKASTGTAVVGQVYDAVDSATVDLLGGPSSEGAIMARHAFFCAQFFGAGPGLKITFVNEPAGGTANVQTITGTGTATADGNQKIRIAGRTFLIGVRVGDTGAVNAAAINQILREAQGGLPVLCTVATNVNTFTHPHKGVNGKDVKIEIVDQVAGITLALATTAVGAGTADIQPALDALAPRRYSGIATANHTSTEINEINLDILVRWGVTSKNWGHYFMGEAGTIGTATALAAAANHRAVVIANWEGCPNAPGELAVTAMMLALSRERPNAGFDGVTVPLYPPPDGTLYTPNERNTAILAGLTVFDAVVNSTGAIVDNRGKCVQLVTTQTTTPGGFPDQKNRDIGVSRTSVFMAIQLDYQVELKFGAAVNPDGVIQDESKPLLLDLAADVLRDAATAKILRASKVEEDIASLVVEFEPSVLGRNNANVPYHVATILHQIAFSHSAIIG